MAALTYPTGISPRAPRRDVDLRLASDRDLCPRSSSPGSLAFHPAGSERRAPLGEIVAFPTPAAARRRLALHKLQAFVAAGGFLAAVWFGSGLLAAQPAAHLNVLAGSVRTADGYRYVVKAGDTVWSIASRLQPTGNLQPLVDQLDTSLGTTVLHPGETVVVP